jgi:hypothetical protein
MPQRKRDRLVDADTATVRNQKRVFRFGKHQGNNFVE